MTEITIKKYRAFDGKEFDTAQDCIDYEDIMATEYEVTYKVDVVLKIDGLIVKRKIRTNTPPIIDCDTTKEFKEIAYDAIWDDDNYETVSELLRLATEQNANIYLDCFEDERIDTIS